MQKHNPSSASVIVAVRLLLCVVCAFLDYGMTFATKVIFPALFLDTLFATAMTFAFGPLYGFFCVLCKHVIVFCVTPDLAHLEIHLYALCTVGAIVIIWLFSRAFLKKETDLLLILTKLFFLAMLVALEMSVVGGLVGRIISFLNGTPSSMTIQTEPFMRFFANFIPSPLVLEMLSRLPVNVIDRIITTFVPYGIAVALRRGEKKLLDKSVDRGGVQDEWD